MHNRIKIRLCLAISVIFVLSLMVHNIGFAVVKTAKDGEYAYNVLTSIGVIKPDISYSPNAGVSRGLFTKLAVEISGNGEIAAIASDDKFADVPSSSEYRAYIDKAYELGYIQGDTSGLFRVKDNVTAVEAVCILSNILGYTQIAESSGAFPSNYMKVASRYELTDGLNVNYDTSLNMEQTMKMLYNAVWAKYYTASVTGKKTRLDVTSGEDNLLAAKFDIYKYEGIVTATAYTDLKAVESQVGRGEAIVDNYKFTDESGIEQYLGYSVIIYYVDDGAGDCKILYSEPNSKVNTVTGSDVRDIVTEPDGVSFEKTDGGRTKTLRFDADASYIVNGKLADITYEDLEGIEKGYVDFICNDNDKKIDVICVTSFDTYVVDGVSAGEYIVRSNKGETVELDPNDDEYVASFMRDDETVGFSSILVGDVILVAESEGRGLNKKYVIISDETIEGTLNGIDEDVLVIDGEEHFYDYDAITGVTVGTSYRFRLDYFGNVVCMDRYDDLVYGYLKFLADDMDENKILCKIFTENGRWVTLYMSEKVKFNGEKLPDNVVYNMLNIGDYRQMIRYIVNKDAEITVIDTAASYTVGTAPEENARKKNKFRISFQGSTRWRTSVFSFSGDLFLNSNAKIFSIPSSDADEDFHIMSPSVFANDQPLTITAYDADESLSSSVAMIKDFRSVLLNEDNVMIVTGKKDMYWDDEMVPALKGYWSGVNITLPVEIGELGLARDDYDNLSKGDVIRFTHNDSGFIDSIERHKISNAKYYNYGAVSGVPAFVRGIVKHNDRSMSKLIIEYSSAGTLCGTTYKAGTPVYIYNKGDNEVQVATVSEILKGDAIFVRLTYLQCQEIIIIRD